MTPDVQPQRSTCGRCDARVPPFLYEKWGCQACGFQPASAVEYRAALDRSFFGRASR